jgi:hypothetical protein
MSDGTIYRKMSNRDDYDALASILIIPKEPVPVWPLESVKDRVFERDVRVFVLEGVIYSMVVDGVLKRYWSPTDYGAMVVKYVVMTTTPPPLSRTYPDIQVPP